MAAQNTGWSKIPPSDERSGDGKDAMRPAPGWQLHCIDDCVGECNEGCGLPCSLPEREIPLDPITSETPNEGCGLPCSLPERVIPLDPITSERMFEPRRLPRTRGAGELESPKSQEAPPGSLPTSASSPQEPPSNEPQNFIYHLVPLYPADTCWFSLAGPEMQMTSHALLPAPAVTSGQPQTDERLPKLPLALPSLSVSAEPPVGSSPPSIQLASVQNSSRIEEGHSLASSLPPQQTSQSHADLPFSTSTAACQQPLSSLPTQPQPECEPQRPPSYPRQPGCMCEGEKQQREAVASQPQMSGHFPLPPTQIPEDSTLSVKPPNKPWQGGFIYSGEQQQAEPPTLAQKQSGCFAFAPMKLQQETGPPESSSLACATGLENRATQCEECDLPSQHKLLPEENNFALQSPQLQEATVPAVRALCPSESTVMWAGGQEQGDPSTLQKTPLAEEGPYAYPQMQRQESSAPSVPQELAHIDSQRQASRSRSPHHPVSRQRKPAPSSQPKRKRAPRQVRKPPKQPSQSAPQTPPDRRPCLQAPPTQGRDVPPLAPPPLPPRLPPFARQEPRSLPPSLPLQPQVFPHANMQISMPTILSPPQLPFYPGLYFQPLYPVMVPATAQCLLQQAPPSASPPPWWTGIV